MNTVLTLALTVSGGLMNILLVLFLLAAVVLIVLAVYLIRRPRRTMSKQAYEQQIELRSSRKAPDQGSGISQIEEEGGEGQEQKRLIPLEQSKQCPFCGTDVFPGGIFCLHCGQRLPQSAQIPRASSPDPLPSPQKVQTGQFPVADPVSSSRPLVPVPQESDDARMRAIEEHPTMTSNVVVTDTAYEPGEAPAIEEWPTLIGTAEAPVEVAAKQNETMMECLNILEAAEDPSREEEVDELIQENNSPPSQEEREAIDQDAPQLQRGGFNQHWMPIQDARLSEGTTRLQ